MMTDQRNDDVIDGVPEDLAENPDSPPAAHDDEARSDIEQVIDARSDALERGDGGPEPAEEAPAGGSDGIVKNQDSDAQ